MAPLTIYPDRRHLIWLIIILVPTTLLCLGGASLVSFAATRAYDGGPLPFIQAFLLGASLLFGLVFLLVAVSHWIRLRSTDPAMSVEDRGLRLLDRPLVSLATRPVFIPWSEIASLKFERGHHARTLAIRTHAGKTHQMIVSTLNIKFDDLAEECLTRAHEAGFIGTAEKRDFFIVDYTEWRLSPV